jgi:hypothetical protein
LPVFDPEPEEPGYELPETPESAWSVDSRRSALVGRLLLLGILVLQAVLSLRLHGTAFEDEALYVASGRYELANVLHGTPVPANFTGYFSGYPKLYPLFAGLVDEHFGLTGVRLASLGFMLCTTTLLYALTRRMFGLRSALGAAALYSVTQSTIFLGSFATFDAAAIMLLAFSAWIVVRTGRANSAAVLLAAPPAALAFAVKYAAGLFIPTLVVLAMFTAYRHRGWRTTVRGLLLGLGIGGLLAACAAVVGSVGGISSTTTNRVHGTATALTLLSDSANWGGLVFLAALGGSIAYVARARMGEMPWIVGDTPGRVRRTGLGLLLTGTALLAPAYQIHLQTETSLFKHVGFGLFFAAPMAGLGLSRLIGPHFRHPQLGILLFVATMTMGMVQSHEEYSYPNSTAMTAYLRTVVGHRGLYLAEESEVPAFYTQDLTTWNQWQNTFDITYTGSDGKVHTGVDGFTAAVQDGHFDLIEMDGGPTPDVEQAVTAALRNNPHYRLVGVFPFTTSYGSNSFRIWVKQ